MRNYKGKKVLSFIMTFVLALTMGLVMVPQRALAAYTWFQAWNDGVVMGEVRDGIDASNLIASGEFSSQVEDLSKVVTYDNTTKTLTFENANLNDLAIDADGITVVFKGICNIQIISLVNISNQSVTGTKFKFEAGSKLNITNYIYVDANKDNTAENVKPGDGNWDLVWNNCITVEGGKVDGGTIEATGGNNSNSGNSGSGNSGSGDSNSGDSNSGNSGSGNSGSGNSGSGDSNSGNSGSGNSGSGDSGSGNSGSSGAQNKTPVKTGDSVQESGKTKEDSPTYKVTSTEEDKKTVTYEKPADNTQGTETIKAKVTLADGNEYEITSISDDAFSSYEAKDKITKIVVGDNVTEIGANACKDMRNLKEVDTGKNTKKIGKGAFRGCTGLGKVTLGDNLETIDDEAFLECKKITNVTLGKKVKKIGNKAYYKCAKLKKITVKTTKLTSKKKVGKNAFGKIHKKASFKIKLKKKDAKKYKSKTVKVFKNKKVGYVKTWVVK